MRYVTNSHTSDILILFHLVINKQDIWSPIGLSIASSRYIFCLGFTVFLYINSQARKGVFEATKPKEEIITARLKQKVWKSQSLLKKRKLVLA